MNETIFLKHSWKAEELIKGAKYHFKSSLPRKIVSIIYFILATCYILFGLYGLLIISSSGSMFSIFLGLLFLFLFLFRNKLNMFFFAKNVKKLNYENKEVQWEINRDKVIYRIINLAESTFSWELIQGVLDTPEGFLLYPQKNTFYWLPKAAFEKEEDIALLAFIAQEKVKNFQQIK
jgi:hypothetical protein